MKAHDTAAALPSALVLAAPWALFLPVGWQYAAFLGCALSSVLVLRRRSQWQAMLRHPVFVSVLVFWAWLLLSALWSPAPALEMVSHLWSYSLLVWVAPIAWACPPAVAARALRHLVWAACVVACFVLLNASGLLPAPPAWRPFVDVEGNQRILFSLLLALAGTLAVREVLERPRLAERGVWLALAMLCLTALTLQDRRTGMLAAPVLLAVLAIARQQGWRRRLLVLAGILLLTTLAGLLSPQVQARFSEGLIELQAYRPEGETSTSWGMRARMLEVTSRMALEAPLFGHGVGSWPTLWRARVHDGALLSGHTTPHNEYLLLAFQGGAVLLFAGLLLLAFIVRRAACHGAAMQPALLVLAAAAWTALFNVVLRDPKFALPLLLLAALAWAAGRESGTPPATTHTPDAIDTE